MSSSAPSNPEVLRPFTFEDGRRLLSSALPRGVAGRVLRGRALLAIQSYEAAQAELEQVLPHVAEPRTRGRVEADLLTLAYYLARQEKSTELFVAAREDACGDAVLLAETYVALSLCSVAANDVRRAIDALHFATDSLRSLPPGRDRSLVAGKAHRQLAHVLAQSADYARAADMARIAIEDAQQVDDTVERARATYTAGFVALLTGRVVEATRLLVEAETMSRRDELPLWRWILLCLGHALAEAGRPLEGTRKANESGFDSTEEYAFIALSRGDAFGARRILANARAPSADELPFRQAVNGVLLAELGDWSGSAKQLELAAAAFGATDLRHYEIGARLHAAYARYQVRRAAGRLELGPLMRDLAGAGAEGFAWFRPAVASWASEGGGDRQTTRLIQSLRKRAAMWRTAALSEQADRASAWRSQGLTWREIHILQAIARQRLLGGPSKRRKELAAELRMSPATLKVHLTRIRGRLGVSERGDDELLSPSS